VGVGAWTCCKPSRSPVNETFPLVWYVDIPRRGKVDSRGSQAGFKLFEPGTHLQPGMGLRNRGAWPAESMPVFQPDVEFALHGL